MFWVLEGVEKKEERIIESAKEFKSTKLASYQSKISICITKICEAKIEKERYFEELFQQAYEFTFIDSNTNFDIQMSLKNGG